MFFLRLIFSNLLVRKTRSIFTVLGVAIATGSVVALIGFSKGFEKSFDEVFQARKIDAVVMKAGSRSIVSNDFPESVLQTIQEIPGSGEVAGILSEIVSVEVAPTVFVMGWERDSFLWDHLEILEGRFPKPGETNAIVLGQVAAQFLEKKIGDTVQIEIDEFQVTAIVASSSLMENSGVILTLDEVQRMFEKEDRLNFLNLRLPPGQTDHEWEKLSAAVEEKLPSYTIVRAQEMASRNMGVQVAKAMSWATSSIALLLGAFGITNTVLMSVFERIREIGILLAIGWHPRRIVATILSESIILTIIGGAVGIALAFAIAEALKHVETIRGKVVADLSPEVILMGVALTIVLGLLGGLYPAWYASRLEPTEALRHE